MTKKKILIIGGTGFIGSHLVLRCVRKNWSVSSISTKLPKNKIKKVKYLKADISNKNDLKKQLKEKYDYVINLGGHIDHSKKIKTYSSHFYGCKNLVKYLSRDKLKKFVQMGSSAEYGNCRSPINEFAKCKPKSFYGKSKYLATKFLIDEYKSNGFPVIIFRLFQAYGPNQKNNRLLPFVIENCIMNQRFNCTSGVQTRDFIYIDDLIDLIFICLRKKNFHGEIFNVGSGKPVKVKFVIKKINSILKKGTPKFGEIKMRKDETLNIYPDIKKIKKNFGWSSKINLEKGLIKTIKSYNMILKKSIKHKKNKAKKILIMGLPGAGKTYLAKELYPMFDAEWINADQVRKKFNDWDFSEAGRKRQAKRMKYLAEKALKKRKNIVADFICPTPETRKNFKADYVIWMDTIKKGRFEDTNKMFIKPKRYDFRFTKKNAKLNAIKVFNKIQNSTKKLNSKIG